MSTTGISLSINCSNGHARNSKFNYPVGLGSEGYLASAHSPKQVPFPKVRVFQENAGFQSEMRDFLKGIPF